MDSTPNSFSTVSCSEGNLSLCNHPSASDPGVSCNSVADGRGGIPEDTGVEDTGVEDTGVGRLALKVRIVSQMTLACASVTPISIKSSYSTYDKSWTVSTPSTRKFLSCSRRPSGSSQSEGEGGGCA